MMTLGLKENQTTITSTTLMCKLLLSQHHSPSLCLQKEAQPGDLQSLTLRLQMFTKSGLTSGHHFLPNLAFLQQLLGVLWLGCSVPFC